MKCTNVYNLSVYFINETKLRLLLMFDRCSFTGLLKWLPHCDDVSTVVAPISLFSSVFHWCPCCCASSEGCLTDTKHHSDAVLAQLDCSRAGRYVQTKKHVCRCGAADLWRDKGGGLVPTGGDAVAAELPACQWVSDASQYHNGLPSGFVCDIFLSYSTTIFLVLSMNVFTL